MGARFWIGFTAAVIAGGILLLIVFKIIGWAVIAWGFLGAMLLIGAVAIAFAWLYDRRQPPRFDPG